MKPLRRLGRLPRDPEGVLRGALRGERRAFDELVMSLREDLSRFIARRVQVDEVDDVLQETWLTAWTNLERFDGRSHFKTWVYGIAVNKSRDHARARRRTQTHIENTALVEVVHNPFERADLRQTLDAALSQLSEAQREVLELYYFAELTLPEVANALNRNLNTVKYQFYRAHSDTASRLKTNAVEGDYVQ